MAGSSGRGAPLMMTKIKVDRALYGDTARRWSAWRVYTVLCAAFTATVSGRMVLYARVPAEIGLWSLARDQMSMSGNGLYACEMPWFSAKGRPTEQYPCLPDACSKSALHREQKKVRPAPAHRTTVLPTAAAASAQTNAPSMLRPNAWLWSLGGS